MDVEEQAGSRIAAGVGAASAAAACRSRWARWAAAASARSSSSSSFLFLTSRGGGGGIGVDPGHGPVSSKRRAHPRPISTRRPLTIRRSSSTSSPATSTQRGRRSSPRAARRTSSRSSSSTTTACSRPAATRPRRSARSTARATARSTSTSTSSSELQRRFGAPGDFAQAYVIAHEIGHHVQNLLGISGRGAPRAAGRSRTQANELSVRLELQADCLAGVWGHPPRAGRPPRARRRRGGARAAAAIGDDRIQKKSRRPRRARVVHARLVGAAGDVVPRGLRQRRPERLRHLQGRGVDAGEPSTRRPAHRPLLYSTRRRRLRALRRRDGCVREEVPPADVAGDLREVLGGLRHRRAVVEAAPDTGVLDVGDELVEVPVRPRRADDGAGDRDRHVLRPEVIASATRSRRP